MKRKPKVLPVDSAPTSPVPKKKKQLEYNFPDAMNEVIAGNKITRKEWPVGEYGCLQDGFLTIVRKGTHHWLVSDGDMLADDWVTV